MQKCNILVYVLTLSANDDKATEDSISLVRCVGDNSDSCGHERAGMCACVGADSDVEVVADHFCQENTWRYRTFLLQ